MTRFGIDALQERVRDAIDAEGLRSFARRANVGVGVARSMVDGRDPSFSNACALARAVGLDLGFGSIPEPAVIDRVPDSEFAHIPLHSAELAAGGGAENGEEAIIDHLAFRRSWLTHIGVSASNAVLARARGDSMLPTIHPGDMLLIDTSKSEPPNSMKTASDKRPAPIFALRDDGGARVKRLALSSPKTVALLSDNPAVPPEFRPISDVHVIGKVMWWGHTNRE